MRMRPSLIEILGILAIGLLCAVAGPGGAARAQAPTAGPVQPWGVPPLPQGVGPVEKFADVSGAPQGQFLKDGCSIPGAICGLWRSAAGGSRT